MRKLVIGGLAASLILLSCNAALAGQTQLARKGSISIPRNARIIPIKDAKLFAVLGGKAPGQVKKGPKRPVQPQVHPMVKLLSGLNLSEDQKNQMKEITLKFQKDMVALRCDLQIKQLELKSLWLAENLDSEALKSKSNEISDLRNQFQEKTIDYQIQLRKVLTPEQWSKLSLLFTFGQSRKGKGLRMPRQRLGR